MLHLNQWPWISSPLGMGNGMCHFQYSVESADYPNLPGIQGATGTPLPRLYLAQLALPLSQLTQKATIFAMKSVTYILTNKRTNGHPQLFK